MNDNARAWVAALRSGKYRQGMGQLHYEFKFCCLGVACDLYAQTNPIEIRVDSTGVAYDGANGLLPTIVQEWLGLVDDAGIADVGPGLYAMNDAGVTFDEIATYIESQPRGLFV